MKLIKQESIKIRRPRRDLLQQIRETAAICRAKSFFQKLSAAKKIQSLDFKLSELRSTPGLVLYDDHS